MALYWTNHHDEPKAEPFRGFSWPSFADVAAVAGLALVGLFVTAGWFF